jgi:hypothetical protein
VWLIQAVASLRYEAWAEDWAAAEAEDWAATEAWAEAAAEAEADCCLLPAFFVSALFVLVYRPFFSFLIFFSRCSLFCWGLFIKTSLPCFSSTLLYFFIFVWAAPPHFF